MEPTVPTRPPRTVTWAFGMWVAATVIGLVGATILFADVPRPGHLLTGGERDTVAALGVMLAAWGLTRLAFAWFMLQGRSWARTLLTTLAALGLATVIFHADHVNPLNGVAVAVNIIAVVLQYVPSSNAYFAHPGPRPSRETSEDERIGASGTQPSAPSSRRHPSEH